MADPLIDRIIGNYRIVELLGEGGMGAVYKAVHTEIESIIAIKVLGLGRDAPEKERIRFLNEAKALGALRHSNILQVFDFVYEDGVYYMLMEYVEGKTVQKLLREREGPLPLAQTARILVQVARALDFAHNRGIIHRDIKPSNILIDQEDNVLLFDFGIAKLTEATTMDLTRDGAAIGTPAYMSPEQAKATDVTGSSDIYSLGVVLYEMITGQLPFSGNTHIEVISKHVNNLPPSPRSINPNLTKRQEAVSLKALEKNPRDRFARAGELSNAFLATISNVSDVALETGSKWERFSEGRFWGQFLRIGRGFRSLTGGLVGLISRSFLSILLGILAILVVLLIGGSVVLGNVMENAIATGDWGFDTMGLDYREEFTPDEFVGGIQSSIDLAMPGSITDMELDPDESGKVVLKASVLGVRLQLDMMVALEEGYPMFKISNLNGYPIPIVSSMIARGINDGFQTALSQSGAMLTSMELSDELIVLVIDGPATQTTRVQSNRCRPGVSLSDDFSDIYSGLPQNFGNDQSGVRYKDGGYSLWTVVPNIEINQPIPCRFQTFDARIEAQALGDPGDASWGLAFNIADTDNFWVFQINRHGWYSLEMYENRIQTWVIDWTDSEGIIGEDIDVLQVIVQEQGELWANGTLLETFEIPHESRPVDGGSFGMWLRSGYDGDVEIIFDNIAVTSPE